jgi:hypothetical protein
MKVVAVFWALVVRVSSTGGQDSRRWSDIPHLSQRGRGREIKPESNFGIKTSAGLINILRHPHIMGSIVGSGEN